MEPTYLYYIHVLCIYVSMSENGVKLKERVVNGFGRCSILLYFLYDVKPETEELSLCEPRFPGQTRLKL